MSFSSSTDSEEVISKQTGGTALIKDTEDQGERSLSYDLYYGKTGRSTELVCSKRKAKSVPIEDFPRIAISEVVNRLLREAYSTVTNLVTVEDPIEQANLAFAFKHCLEDLWENRCLREDNWGDLLNILQAVLAQVEFEQLSDPQKSGIKKVVTEYLCKGEIADPDMEEALGVLSNAGFDPWRGISGQPKE